MLTVSQFILQLFSYKSCSLSTKKKRQKQNSLTLDCSFTLSFILEFDIHKQSETKIIRFTKFSLVLKNTKHKKSVIQLKHLQFDVIE